MFEDLQDDIQTYMMKTQRQGDFLGMMAATVSKALSAIIEALSQLFSLVLDKLGLGGKSDDQRSLAETDLGGNSPSKSKGIVSVVKEAAKNLAAPVAATAAYSVAKPVLKNAVEKTAEAAATKTAAVVSAEVAGAKVVGAKVVGEIAEKGVKGAASKAAVEIVETGAKTGAKVVTKLGAKTGAKFVPGVGQVAGIAFAAKDTCDAVQEGNTKYAVQSGVETALYVLSAASAVTGTVAAINCWNPGGWVSGAISVVAGTAALGVGVWKDWDTYRQLLFGDTSNPDKSARQLFDPYAPVAKKNPSLLLSPPDRGLALQLGYAGPTI